MKILGDDVYIQRGETWSLDFNVTNAEGDPYMIFSKWKNPYLAITVTAARYEQKGDFRQTYWLSLKDRYVEKADGSIVLETLKKFISTEVLYLVNFDIDEVMSYYGENVGGRIVLDDTSDFDITNYLFYTDPNGDGNKIYKYVSSYTLDNGNISNVVWTEYSFAVIKSFNTKNWTEQSYLFDVKLLSGESVKEHIASLVDSTISDDIANAWSTEETQNYIDLISDADIKKEMQDLFDSNVPLMSTYDTKALILQPTNLYVSANIQGGVE